MNKTLIALAGIAALLVIAFLGYELLAPQVNQCEQIFQQTTPSLATNVKFLESEGSVALGRNQIQELSDRAQEIALNLKSCCVMIGSGNDRLDQFNQCKASAVSYDKQVAAAVEAVKSAADASAAGKTDEQQKAAERLTQIIQAATEASEALEKQVIEITEEETQPGAQSNATGVPATAEPGQLRARAALTEGGEQINACFYVYEPKEDLQGNRKEVDRACSNNAVFTLPVGDYVVAAGAGNASASTPLTIRGGQLTDHNFDLNAGYLRARAALTAGGEQLSACFYVYEPREDLQGNRKEVDRACADNAVFTLPAGDYVVTAAAGDAATTTPLAVQAGGITNHVFDLNAGYLRARAALVAGGEHLSACFYIYEPKEDLQGNHKEVNRACTDNAVFTLPAGDYLVSAYIGDASASARLAVQAGQITNQVLVLNAGYLRARATLKDGGEPVSACFYIYEPKEDLQGNRREINRACTDNAVFTLPAGAYLLTAASGETAATATLEIKPGEVTEQMLTLSKAP